MRFYIPTDVYIEKDCVKNHKEDLCKIGKHAFIITGKHSAKANGSLQDVTDCLVEAGISYDIFSDVEENPSVETCEKAAAIGKDCGADFVIGIGGGSPMDAAKAIALLINNPEETGECFYNPKALTALPVVAVPTTCGTGSEVTGVSVLTNHKKRTKKSIAYKIFPVLALVDGKYLEKAGHNLIVNTAIDSLAHAVESYLHKTSNTYNRMFSEYALRQWATIKDALLSDDRNSEKTNETLMLISTISGMAIAHTATSLPHGMSYELTYEYGIPHGKACGIFLASYMRFYAKHDPETVDAVLGLLDFDSLDTFEAFIKSLIGETEIKREEALYYADCLMNNAGKLSTCPFPVTKDIALSFYEDSLKLV